MTGRKSFTPEDVKLSDTGEVSVAFSRFDVIDHDQDVTRKSAIPVGTTVAMSNFGHSSWDSAPPIGKGILGATDELATFTGSFFMSTDQGRNAYNTVKEMGDLQEWSYGFTILDSAPITFNGTAAREIKQLDIYEVSPVLKGAGISTHTIAIKSGAPGTDAPYAEHLSWYVDGLSALIERTKDRAEFRSSEGRKLSAADLARLADLEKQLTEHLEDVKAAQVVPEDPESIRQRQQAIDIAIATARRLGVDI